MKVNLTVQDLISFEQKICQLFEEKKIKGPVHLESGNERQMIDIFTNHVEENSYVCCSWRSHFKSLLKGVPQEEMISEICEGRSISLCFPKHKVISSGIVGGIVPIAVGIAMGIKLKCENTKVICFVGDMTSETGIFHECLKYSTNHELPILFVVENNKKSVCTVTKETWKLKKFTFEPENYSGGVVQVLPNVLYYEYESIYPHAGGLTRTQF